MIQPITDLQKQIRAVMPDNTLNGEQIATDIAEWMVREGYNKLEPLDDVDRVQHIVFYSTDDGSLRKDYDVFGWEEKSRKIAERICKWFGKPEIKLPTSKLSPDDIKDGWDAGYVRGWEEYDEGLKRLNGLEAK